MSQIIDYKKVKVAHEKLRFIDTGMARLMVMAVRKFPKRYVAKLMSDSGGVHYNLFHIAMMDLRRCRIVKCTRKESDITGRIHDEYELNQAGIIRINRITKALAGVKA